MKKTILTILKIAVSTLLIGWILQRSDLEAIWMSIRGANFLLVAVAFVMYYIGYLIIAQRQKSLLGALKISVGIPFLLQSFAIGMFFTNLLPSTIGGDASRMYDVWKVAGSKSKAVSVILIDRFFGLFALVTFGFLAALVSQQVQQAIPNIVLYMGSIWSVMALALWVIFGSGAVVFDWFLRLPLGPLSIVQRLFNKLYQGFSLFRGRRDVLLTAMFWSLLLQLNVILHFVLLTRALSIEVPVLAMFVIVPVAMILLLIPLSINGIGLREAVFAFLFGIFGVVTEPAVAFAWIALGMILVQGVVGGIVFLLRRKHQPSGPVDTT